MEQIFIYLILAVIAIVTISIFIQSVRDLYDQRMEVLDDIMELFKGTKLHMNYKNRRNKVEIISKDEYMSIWSGKTVEME